MGRTKHFICRQARALGLTDQKRAKPFLATWKYVDEPSARAIFEQFKQSAANLGQFCAERKFDTLGFSRCMKQHFPDEWEHVIESKQIAQSWYRYGRQFEYRVRDQLKANGYFAMRSPASKTPIDLIGIKPGVVLFIQCKRSGVLNPKEWNELYDLAVSCGAIPILASTPRRRVTDYERLLTRKDGSRGQRQPKEPFDPFGEGGKQ